MLRYTSLALIGLYQRDLSPRKGYACAHRVHTGRASCSGFGRRVIGRYGLIRGLAFLRLRFAACARSAEALRSQQADPSLNQPCPLRLSSKQTWITGASCCCF